MWNCVGRRWWFGRVVGVSRRPRSHQTLCPTSSSPRRQGPAASASPATIVPESTEGDAAGCTAGAEPVGILNHKTEGSINNFAKQMIHSTREQQNSHFFYKYISVLMDRDWMSADRLSIKYREGVDLFLEFAEKKASNPNFVHCPEQPDDNQCGYYSMRFIKSFMTENNPTRKSETEFKRNKSSSYTNKEINEIRDEWAKK
ncbi:hypothetical protein G4B88_005586 [Cannabis sativa]|uniref:Ubiquitin-like protease family profile domain-containing protein n=1 Tax=Cannabis sativa TaxID=3483 RepID=A0A7J6HAW1_CANSA|nr:hypothetical protein G4B88_005586 [Cannabis sativa]